MLTSKEAEKLAIISIKKFLGSSKRWMTDENIGYVMNYIRKAEMRHDPSKGKITTIMYHYTKGACGHIYQKSKAKKRIKKNYTNSEEYFLANVIYNHSEINFEFLDYIIKASLLSVEEEKLMRWKFEMGMSVKQMCDEGGYTKIFIYSTLKQAFKKIRNKIPSKEILLHKGIV